MNPDIWTGRRLWHALRQAGVALSVNGDRLAFDAPAGAVTPELRSLMKAHKPELVALVQGDYVRAALERVMKEPDPEQRETMAKWFDVWAAACEFERGMKRDEARRTAFITLCRWIEAGRLGSRIQVIP